MHARGAHYAPIALLAAQLFERLVDEGAYSEEYASRILKQIAIALYHLHSRGIVHRDIKPENVVFETEEKGDTHVKLIDFGTAVALEERGAPRAARAACWRAARSARAQHKKMDASSQHTRMRSHSTCGHSTHTRAHSARAPFGF